MPGNNGWTFDWEGREFTLGEDRFKVKTQLSEWVDDVLAQRHALTFVQSLNRDIEVMLKIRCDLNPKNFPFVKDVRKTQRIGERHVLFEASLYKVIYGIGHGPKFVQVSKHKQLRWMPYPEGQVYFTILECVPGEDASKIRNRLSYQQCCSIRFQLAKILETMADKNGVLRTADLSLLRYDWVSDKLRVQNAPPHSIKSIDQPN